MSVTGRFRRDIRVHSLREPVYEEIKTLILHNQLRPGEKITIDQLASELGVSQTPVREALVRLQADGLVVVERYRTPRVAAILPQDVREVYEVRMLLEGWAGSQAAALLSTAEIDSLAGIVQRGRDAARDGEYDAYVSSDIGFHRSILGAVKNSLFLRLAESVTDRSVRIRSLVEVLSPSSIEHVIDEHLSVVEALRARDAEQARQRTLIHLQAAMARTLAALGTQVELD